MKKIITSLLLLTWLLGACSTTNTPPVETEAIQPSAQTSPEVAPVETESVVRVREAVLSEFENSVLVKVSASDEFVAATQGISILAGGGIETGDDGRARLDLLPEGTIVRVGPSSSFTLPEMTDENGEPKTTLELLFGKVFILLNGGSLDVKTASGVASVRGSVLSVTYNPVTNRVEAVCLEGHCALEDEEGNEVELEEGEKSYIEDNEEPVDPEEINSEEIQDWLDESPELYEFMDELPNPEDYPAPEEGWTDWSDWSDSYDWSEFTDGEYPTPEEATMEPESVPTDAPTDEPAAGDPAPTDEPTGP